MANFIYKPIKGYRPKRNDEKICKNHPTSLWSTDSNGNFYAKCYKGQKRNEECEELEDE